MASTSVPNRHGVRRRRGGFASEAVRATRCDDACSTMCLEEVAKFAGSQAETFPGHILFGESVLEHEGIVVVTALFEDVHHRITAGGAGWIPDFDVHGRLRPGHLRNFLRRSVESVE
jgi:hypothetical protein